MSQSTPTRRFLVMDLFHCHETVPVGNWITKFPDQNSKVLAKLKDGAELFAYYFKDSPNGCHFWSVKDREPIVPDMWKHVIREG